MSNTSGTTVIANLKICRHVGKEARDYDHGHFDAQCGRCGQYLGCVSTHALPDDRRARLVPCPGWHYDGDTWRPTQSHLEMRHRDERRLADQQLSQTERYEARGRLRNNNYGQSREGRDERRGDHSERARRKGVALAVDAYVRWSEADGIRAGSLPTRIECPSLGCRAVNLVTIDTAQR